MERINLKNHKIMGGRLMKDPIDKNKVRESREYCTSYEKYDGGDLLSGYLWNPRSYTCSFCKREFRSAQALGGHMNVHRRERARLRQYSPPNYNPNPLLNLNLNTNPNPNPSKNPNVSFSSQLSSPSTDFSQITTNLPPIEAKKWMVESSTCHFEDDQDTKNIKYSKALFELGNFEGFGNVNEHEVLKNAQVVRLDLEIGLIYGEKEAMDLDLELRLGR